MIAFINKGAVWLTTPEGARPHLPVTAGDTARSALPGSLQWPVPETIFYKAFDAEGESSIWSVSAKGGRPKLLVRFDDPSRPSSRPEFATDGKRLYFSLGQRKSDIW